MLQQVTKEQFMATPRAKLACKRGREEDDAQRDSQDSHMESSQHTKKRKFDADEDTTAVKVCSYITIFR